jgi:hypothetical protein
MTVPRNSFALMPTMTRMGALLVLVIGCSREPALNGAIFCRALTQDASGNNPLIEGKYLCFDSREACGTADCAVPVVSRWSCFTPDGPAADPMVGITSCMPTEAMCKVNRYSQSWPCHPVDAVYCRSIGHGLDCAASEVDCVFRDRLTQDVTGLAATACMRR